MNFNNLINEFLNFSFVIGDMSICILMVKFVLSLALLIIIIKVHNHYNFIKF